MNKFPQNKFLTLFLVLCVTVAFTIFPIHQAHGAVILQAILTLVAIAVTTIITVATFGVGDLLLSAVIDCATGLICHGGGDDGGGGGSVGGGCVGNSGSACTSGANSCGQTNSGTIDCSGNCNASTPANPSGYGSACSSAVNTCGQANSGAIDCNGACNASTPSNPSGYGSACVSAGNFCGQTNSGTGTCSGTCSASTPPDSGCPHPSCTFGTSQQITYPNSATLLWNCEYASSCSINGISVNAQGGSKSVSPSQDTSYKLTCNNPGHPEDYSPSPVNISVIYEPICSFSVDRSKIVSPQRATLSWSCEYANSCNITQSTDSNIVPANAQSGTRQVSPSQKTIYTLTCENRSYSTTKSQSVTVSGSSPSVIEVAP